MGQGLDLGVETAIMIAGLSMVIVIILFIMMINVLVKFKKLRKRYVQMLNGVSSADVESIMIELQESMNRLKEENRETKEELQALQKQIKTMKSNVGVHRYSAFADGGSDLSFSIAIVDDNQDGLVLTGIHSRETSFIYAKPIVNGQSKYMLSPEEKKEAINRSLPKEPVRTSAD